MPENFWLLPSAGMFIIHLKLFPSFTFRPNTIGPKNSPFTTKTPQNNAVLKYDSLNNESLPRLSQNFVRRYLTKKIPGTMLSEAI